MHSAGDATGRGQTREREIRNVHCPIDTPDRDVFMFQRKTKSWQNVTKGISTTYMPTPTLTNEIIAAAILGFEEQKRKIDIQVAELRTMLSGAPVEQAATSETAHRPRRKVSAAGRKAMALAQQKRWAAKKAMSEPEAPMPAKPKRKMSEAGRAAIAAAVKKRWAAKNAAAKK